MSARRTLLLAASAALVVSTLAGCGGSDEPSKNAESSTLRPGSDPAENASVAQRYFEAVVSNDADVQSDALEFAAPESPAATYLTHLANTATAYAGAGEERKPDQLTEVAGGYRACLTGDGDCVKYSALVLSDGKLNSFTVDGAAIDEGTALGQRQPQKLGSLGTVELLSRSTAGNTYVVNLHVTSGDRAITLENAGTTFEQDGSEIEPARVVGPKELDANSDATVSLVFSGAKAGPGSLEYSVKAANGDGEDATLRIR